MARESRGLPAKGLHFLATTMFWLGGCADPIDGYCANLKKCSAGFDEDTCRNDLREAKDFAGNIGCGREFDALLACTARESCDTLGRTCTAENAALTSCSAGGGTGGGASGGTGGGNVSVQPKAACQRYTVVPGFTTTAGTRPCRFGTDLRQYSCGSTDAGVALNYTCPKTRGCYATAEAASSACGDEAGYDGCWACSGVTQDTAGPACQPAAAGADAPIPVAGAVCTATRCGNGGCCTGNTTCCCYGVACRCIPRGARCCTNFTGSQTQLGYCPSTLGCTVDATLQTAVGNLACCPGGSTGGSSNVMCAGGWVKCQGVTACCPEGDFWCGGRCHSPGTKATDVCGSDPPRPCP